jgi:hypothetical protein
VSGSRRKITKGWNELCPKQHQLLGQLIASGGFKPPAGWWMKKPTTTSEAGHGSRERCQVLDQGL